MEGALRLGPIKYFGLITFGAVTVVAVTLWRSLSFELFFSWMIAINMVSFLTYGYDKAISGSGNTRVPERVLLALAFAGGTIGTFAGRAFFHHKTIKMSFRVQLWIVVGIQIILVLGYLAWNGEIL